MLNKVTKNIVSDEEILDFQPSDKEIEQYESDSNLSDEEYAHLQKELDYFYTTPPPSYYSLSRDDNRGDWDKPSVTRTKNDLFDQLYFYDAIRERETLTKSQLEDVQKEVDKIHKELGIIEDYQYFLKHGCERTYANKNQFKELQNIKFYQREENLWVFDSVEDHIKINLPIEKWWISENEIIKHADVDLHTFVDFRLINSLIPSLNKHKYSQIKFASQNESPVIQQEIVTEKTMPNLPPKDEKRSFIAKFFKKNNKQKMNNSFDNKNSEKNPTPGNFPSQKDKPTPSPNQFPDSRNEDIAPNPFPNPSNNPSPSSNFPTNDNKIKTPPIPPPGIANNNKTSSVFGAPPIPPRNFATSTSNSSLVAPPIPPKVFPNALNRSNATSSSSNKTNNYFDYQSK